MGEGTDPFTALLTWLPPPLLRAGLRRLQPILHHHWSNTSLQGSLTVRTAGNCLPAWKCAGAAFCQGRRRAGRGRESLACSLRLGFCRAVVPWCPCSHSPPAPGEQVRRGSSGAATPPRNGEGGTALWLTGDLGREGDLGFLGCTGLWDGTGDILGEEF